MDEFKSITYKEFYEAFNAISDNHACPAYRIGLCAGVAIVDEDGEFMANLYDDNRTWGFDVSAFNTKELDLMSKPAGNMPEFRGEINNG